jgi:predicted  nucleic acid-binding Zn-ribbon protein
LLSYSTNQEIPANVRTALARAVELRRAVEAAEAGVREIEVQRSRLISDQDRIRRNLEAAGNQTPQGQEYLRRLVSLDGEIDALAPVLEKANTDTKAAQQAYESYLSGLNLQ